MEQVTGVFPSSQRALFQKYHVGGCSSCGFQPTDTLGTVAMNHGLDVNEVVEFIQRSQDMEKDLEITPREVAELLKQGKIKLLDVRTPQEYAIASIPGSVLVDQSLAQEIMQSWPKDTEIVTICHHGMSSLDACAYLRGHGFTNTKSMTGGIEAWALQVDPRSRDTREPDHQGDRSLDSWLLTSGFLRPRFPLPIRSLPKVIFPNTLALHPRSSKSAGRRSGN